MIMKTFFICAISFLNYAYAQNINYNIDPIIDYDKAPINIKNRINDLAPLIEDVSKSLKVDTNLLVSVAWTESHFKKNSLSHKGAKGLMQVLPKTRSYILKKMGNNYNILFTKNLSRHSDYKEIEDIILGSYYIKYLLIKFNYNVDHAIMAYNMGPKWVHKKLKSKQIIGNNNLYLNKVRSKMMLLASK